MPGLRLPAPVPIVIPKRRKLSLRNEHKILLRWSLLKPGPYDLGIMSSRPIREQVGRMRNLVVCASCEMVARRDQYHYDHEIARELGGSDDPSNQRPYCLRCHAIKTGEDAKLIAKGRRIRGEKGRRNPKRKPRKKIPARKKPWPPRTNRKLRWRTK